MDGRLSLVTGSSTGSIVLDDRYEMSVNATRIEIGEDVWIEPGTIIGQEGKDMSLFKVGDHTRIFAGIIAPSSFEIGDYGTIHSNVFCYGRGPAKIGHNAWFGMRCTLDAEGEFKVGHGFGAGQDSHLWSHIRHGDMSLGCNYLAFSRFEAKDDVWFVGRTTSGPTGEGYHESFSVALTESNVTKPMEYNHVYGGNPAKDLTEKIGAPYSFPGGSYREEFFNIKVDAFIETTGADRKTVERMVRFWDYLTRRYPKTNEPLEVEFMRFLLPEMKFTPV